MAKFEVEIQDEVFKAIQLFITQKIGCVAMDLEIDSTGKPKVTSFSFRNNWERPELQKSKKIALALEHSLSKSKLSVDYRDGSAKIETEDGSRIYFRRIQKEVPTEDRKCRLLTLENPEDMQKAVELGLLKDATVRLCKQEDINLARDNGLLAE